jgi:hypothetical protein
MLPLLWIVLMNRGVYYARDHLESGGGKKMKNLIRWEKNEFQLSGAKLKYFLGHFLRGKKNKISVENI